MENLKPDDVLRVRVNRIQVDRLREIANLEHRTVSQEVRRLIDIRISEFDHPEQEQAA